MIEIGIPVYHSREVIRDALDSLVAQTKKMFIVCLSIDGDGEDYSDIIKTYQERGLKFRVLQNEHGGPGAARQRILETTQCDYIMFLDSDDMLLPQAIQTLFRAIRQDDYDIIRSGILREEISKSDVIIPGDGPTVTWTHGKIYKVAYLRENKIRFLSELKTDEDANFNLIAWNCTKNRGQITDLTYYWRYNKNSITRGSKKDEYFRNTYTYYIKGQVKALKKIAQLRPDAIESVIGVTLPNVYHFYMKARYYKLDETPLNEALESLQKYDWMQNFISNGHNWLKMLTDIKPAEFLEEEKTIIFYEEAFNKWVVRLLSRKN